MIRSVQVAMTSVVVLAMAMAACGGPPNGNSGSADSTTKFNLTYATFVSKSDTFAQQAKWFMQQTEERSKGRIAWKSFLDGTLLSAADMFEGVRNGRADAGHVANVYSPQNLPLSQITVPFLSTDGLAVTKTLETMYSENKDFRDEWESQGIKVLAFGITGNATVGVNVPVTSLDDLKGKKLRAAGLTGVALKSIGVDSIGLTLPETYEAIQRGVVDGFAGFPFATANAAKMPEVAKYNIDTGMGVFAVVGVVSISMRTWKSLPNDLQEVMLDVADEVTDSTVDLVNQAGVKACDDLLAAGGSVKAIPEAERKAWMDNMFESTLLPRYKADATTAGADPDVVDSFTKAFRKTLAANEADSSFADGFTACAKRS